MHLADPALEARAAGAALAGDPPRFDGWCLGWARFDADGGPIWGWDSVLPGERAVLRLLPEHDTAVAVMTNSDAGRARCRPVLREVLASFGIGFSPLVGTPGPARPATWHALKPCTDGPTVAWR